mgnify:FL=1
MKDGRVQNPKKQKIGGLSLGWLLVTLCVLIYGTYAIGDKAMTISQLNSDMDQARLRLEEAQRENQQLKEENASLSDDAYIEKLAREELGMTRKGEIPYIYAENK